MPILLISLFIILCPSHAMALSAFTGAEGFGSTTAGGRGGTVIKVKNLNDSGIGSFREAVTKTLTPDNGRIIVFDVSGVIHLSSPLTMNKSNMTIAGQTSPDGIMVSGYTVTLNAHDVIIRHMRFRVGTRNVVFDTDANGNKIFYSQPQYNFPVTTCAGTVTTEALGYPCAKSGANPEMLDSFDIVGNGQGYYSNDAYNIVIDHCSFGWGVDETFSTAYNPKNITIQWSIFSEALSKSGHPRGRHSKGVLFWNKYSPETKVSFHHNYMAHNADRNPLVNTGTWDDTTLLDAVNNVTYNQYQRLGAMSQGAPKVNWIHNYVKKGIDDGGFGLFEVTHEDSDGVVQPMIYVQGNLGMQRQTQSDPEWCVGNSYTANLISTNYQRPIPWPADTVNSQIMSQDIANWVVASAGATAPRRDSVDTRVVNDFAAGTGRIIDNVAYPADYPAYTNITPPIDSDDDGMPDTWETSKGLNKSLNDSAADRDSDGYTNIEEYINSLASGAIPGICGSYNGIALSSAPITGLCSVGTPSAVTGTGPWSWTCAGSGGGITANCSATLLEGPVGNASALVACPVMAGFR